MPSSEYLFVHPLLGADDAWSGYRIETRGNDALPAALGALNTLAQFDEFDHRHPWFIPAFPGSDARTRLGERAVTVFPAAPPTAQAKALKEQEATLRQASAPVALIAASEAKLPSTGSWDYLLIGTGHARSLPPFMLMGFASRTVVIATDVHSHADRAWLLDNACTLSTGEFLLTRSQAGKKADTTRVHLLELLSLIAQDADSGELDAIFRKEPKLSYSLLRLVNSAAIAPRSPITSFAQAINLLGRRQLQRWLQLLVYADPNNGQQPNPLLQKAAARGRLLELLSEHLNPRPVTDYLEDTAFMVGTFSLLDVLLNMSITEILRQLPLTEVVLSALGEHGGTLGQLLRAINAAEARDFDLATDQLGKLGIAPPTYLEAQLSALGWAARIRPAG